MPLSSSVPDHHTGTAAAKFHGDRDILKRYLAWVIVACALAYLSLGIANLDTGEIVAGVLLCLVALWIVLRGRFANRFAKPS